MLRPWYLLVAVGLVAAWSPAHAYHKIIIVDRSGSMADAAPGEQPPTPKFRQVVALALEEIELDLAAKIDRITLVFFDHQVSGVVEIGSMAEARRALDGFPPQGQTNIGDTLAFALELLKGNPGERYFVVSLYTDGQEALTDRRSQKVTMEEARRRFIEHLGGLKQRTFVSFYNHQWNSPENKDFSRLLKSIQAETAANTNLELVIEENPDPSRRSTFAGIVLRLDREKVYLERPRDGVAAELDLGLAFQATPLAWQSKLVFDLRPRIEGMDQLTLKCEPSRLVIDRAGGTVPLKLLIKGLDKIVEGRPYELEIQPTLVEGELDNLLLERIKTRKVVLRIMPDKLYAQFTMAPTPSFELDQPRRPLIQTALKVRRAQHHEVTLAWNQTAVGSRVQWSVSPSLAGIATLVDASQKRLDTYKLTLDSSLRRTFYLRLELQGGGGAKGTIDFAGDGKLAGRTQKLDIAIAEQKGTLQVLFPDNRERKLFAGSPVLVPLGMQVKPDRLAEGEAYVIRTDAPPGVKLEVRDEFDRPIGGKKLTIDGAQLAHYALRLEVDPGVAVDKLDASRLKIVVTPADSNRLQVVGADGSPGAEFGLPFALVAPQKELAAQLVAPAACQLRRGGAAVDIPLELAWSEDANREAFAVEVAPEVTGRDRGPAREGLEWSWDDGSRAPRTFDVGGGPTTTHRLGLRFAAKGEGEWLVAVSVRALGRTQVVELPIRAVVGEANVGFVPAGGPFVAGVAQPIGVLRVAPRNPFAAGEGVRVEAVAQAGVALSFIDKATGRRLEPGAPWALPEADALEVEVTARAAYEALAEGIQPANALVLRSSGPALELYRDDRQEAELRLPLSWSLARPTLTHRSGDAPSGDLTLGAKPIDGDELVSADSLALKMALDPAGLPDDLAKRLRSEVVRLTWAEWDRSSTIAAVVFTATGGPEARVEELLADGRFTVRFKPGVQHGLAAAQPVYAEIALATAAPVELTTPKLRVKVDLPPRLKLPALAGILVALLLLVVGVARLFAGGTGSAKALVGTIETASGQRVGLDGFEVIYVAADGGRLTASSLASDRAIAKLHGTAKGPVLAKMGDQRIQVGGIDVVRPIALADGVALTLGGVAAIYRLRSAEAAPGAGIDLSAPRAARDSGGGSAAISLDPVPRAAPAPGPVAPPRTVNPPPPPRPGSDDEEGIVL